jgi:hypothetical protein
MSVIDLISWHSLNKRRDPWRIWIVTEQPEAHAAQPIAHYLWQNKIVTDCYWLMWHGCRLGCWRGCHLDADVDATWMLTGCHLAADVDATCQQTWCATWLLTRMVLMTWTMTRFATWLLTWQLTRTSTMMWTMTWCDDVEFLGPLTDGPYSSGGPHFSPEFQPLEII